MDAQELVQQEFRRVFPGRGRWRCLAATSAPGLASRAPLTPMRPASPVSCEPAAVIAPLMGVLPSVKNGSCTLPAANAVAVVVEATELTTVAPKAELNTCSTVPDGLENCSLDPT